MQRPTAAEFEQYVEQHQSMVFSIAYHILNERTAAEDVAQEVFLQLYSKLESLESPEHVQFWLRRTTAHRAIDNSRRNHSHRHSNLEDVPEPSIDAANSDPMLERRLRKVIASLPDAVRAVVILRYQEDLGPEDIAKVLGIPLNTVKSQLHRALATLRDKISRTVGEISI
jgi:RNA polymerase sigma-70 factor (ECF subfamily)